MKGTNRKMKFGTIIAAAALTVLTACGPKKPFADSKTPISEKPIPALKTKPSEKAISVLFSEWAGGLCSINTLFGLVTYKDKEYNETNSFEANISETEKIIGFHCSDEKTMIVKQDDISIYGQGAVPRVNQIDGNMLATLQDVHGAPVEILSTNKMFPNEKNEINTVSASSENEVLVLAKDTETGDLTVKKLSLDYDEAVDYFSIGKLFKGKVNIAVHNGIVFIAGESEKGKNYLHALKLSGKAVGIPFKTKKELKGEVKFSTKYDESGEKALALEIGEKKFYIDLEVSKIKLPDFEDMGDETFVKITIRK